MKVKVMFDSVEEAFNAGRSQGITKGFLAGIIIGLIPLAVFLL